MPGNLRDIKEIEAEVDAAGFRGITKQQILDTLVSQAKVGGCLSVNAGISPDQDITIAGGFNRIDVWERSVDTQGVKDGLNDGTDPGGWYRINNAAAGDYTCSANLHFSADLAGEYEIRLARVESDEVTVLNTPYHDAVTLGVDGETRLGLGGAIVKDLARNERLQLEIKGPNGAVVTVLYAQFMVQR